MKEYKKRIADQILADKLEAMGAVLIEGPKYCGKTTLATQQAKSILYMADPDTKSQKHGLIEIKLGGDTLIKEGAENLQVLANKLDTTKMKKPSFLMVLTGVGNYAYKRPEDGVLVVPIGCLKD